MANLKHVLFFTFDMQIIKSGISINRTKFMRMPFIIYYLMEFKNNKKELFYRYNKITQQKKFHLLNLVLKEKKSIKQASGIVEINYSTAKTIIFFHRNNLKSYQFDFRLQKRYQKSQNRVVASYQDITNQINKQLNFGLIQVFSTIGSKTTNIDFNSLQTRFMDNHLDHTNSSQKHYDPQLVDGVAYSQLDLKQMQICQCERRTTRAQSAKQAAKFNFYPPAVHRQEQSCGDGNPSQRKNQ